MTRMGPLQRASGALGATLLLVVAGGCATEDTPTADGATSTGASTSTAPDVSDITITSQPLDTEAADVTVDDATTPAPTAERAASSTESADTAAPDAVERTSSDDAVDTPAGVEAAQWSGNVEISFSDESFTFRSDSLPSHELPDQFLIPQGPPGGTDPDFLPTDTDTLLAPATLETEIPLTPVYSDEVTPTQLGQIGVVISGAQLFNDYEDMERSVVALDDQTIIDGVGFVDACNGHPLATGADYHYHGIPYCISDAIDADGEHSTILGFLLDGFPVYANQDENGATITSAELDECSGHFGPTPEFPEGIYHYHLTDDAAPYSIDCFHGVVSDDYGAGAGGGPPGGGGDGPGGGGPPPGDRGGPGGGPPQDGAAPGAGGAGGQAPPDGGPAQANPSG